jgi:DNA-binding MarR family transcriptional regulator
MIIRLSHEIVQYENANLSERGLNCSKSNIIAFLWHNQDKTINQTAIATNFGVKGSSVTSILSAMEKQGLITRTKDPADSRNRIVTLTDAGLELNTVLQGQLRALESRMLKGITERQRRTLMNILRKVLANFEEAR